MSTNTKAVCLLGKKGSGKSEAAKFIMEAYPEFKKFSYGDALKNILHEFLDLPIDFFYNPLMKERPLDIENLNKDQKKKIYFLLMYPRFVNFSRFEKYYPYRSESDLLNFLDEEFYRLEGLTDDNLKRSVSPRLLMQTVGTDVFRKLNQDIWLILATGKLKKMDFVVVDDIRFENELKLIEIIFGKDNVKTIYIFSPHGQGHLEGHISENSISPKNKLTIKNMKDQKFFEDLVDILPALKDGDS